MMNKLLLGVIAASLMFAIGCEPGDDGGGDPTPTPTTDPNPTYTIGGDVTGLTGQVELTEVNSGATKMVTTNNAPYAFDTALASGTAYNVQVLNDPAGQACTVANPTSSVGSSNVTNINVNCIDDAAPTYTIGGYISGIPSGVSASVILETNPNQQTVIRSINGSFTFPNAVVSGTEYNVTVELVSGMQSCSVTGGASGTVNNANVTNITVVCTEIPQTRYVFETSANYDGNLGGLAGADAICQAAADSGTETVLHGKTFKAWLSTFDTSAYSRLEHANVNYIDTAGSVIANDWWDLTDGSIATAIGRDENGSVLAGEQKVWSGTRYWGGAAAFTSGEDATNANCDSWTSNNESYTGTIGYDTETNEYWTGCGEPSLPNRCWEQDANGKYLMSCSKKRRLYCFQHGN